MQVVKIVCWEEEGGWIGYLQEYPDYWTQGKTLKELKSNLTDLFKDLTSGEIPAVRKIDDLVIT